MRHCQVERGGSTALERRWGRAHQGCAVSMPVHAYLNLEEQKGLVSVSARARPGLPELISCDNHKRGGLSDAEIQAEVRSNYDAIRACYEDGLGRNPRLAGRLTLKFAVDEEGNVPEAYLSAAALSAKNSSQGFAGSVRADSSVC